MGGHTATRTKRQAVQLSKAGVARQGEDEQNPTIELGNKKIPVSRTGEAVENRFYEIKDGTAFHDAIHTAKFDGLQDDIDKGTYGTKQSKWYGQFVHTYGPEDYQKMKSLIVLDDGSGGLAVKDNKDVVSVFRNPTMGKRGVIDTLMPEAIAAGGDHLDCFNGYLPGTYAKFGFVPVARVKFSRGDAPEHWNYERDGEPDIIFMAHDGRSVEQIRKDTEDFQKLTPEERKHISSEQGKKIQQQIESLPYIAYDDASRYQTGDLMPESLRAIRAANTAKGSQI
jgi:hypothetical protein